MIPRRSPSVVGHRAGSGATPSGVSGRAKLRHAGPYREEPVSELGGGLGPRRRVARQCAAHGHGERGRQGGAYSTSSGMLAMAHGSAVVSGGTGRRNDGGSPRSR